MMILFLLSCFGIWFADRILNFVSVEWSKDAPFSPLPLRLGIWSLMGVWIFLFRNHLYAIWGMLFFIYFLPTIYNKVKTLYLDFKFEMFMVHFLDQLILSMLSGKSFKQSFLNEVEVHRGPFRSYLQDCLTLLQYNKNQPNRFSGKMNLLYEEFYRIQESNHKSIDKLRSLRRKLKLVQTVNEKTNRVLLQTKTQSLVLIILYIFLFFIVRSQYMEMGKASWLFINVIYFSLGQIYLYFLPRSFKWKI